MKVGEWGKIRAFFDVETSEGFQIKGFKLINGINGLFVGMPSIKDGEAEGKYNQTVYITNKVAQGDLENIALARYDAETSNSISEVPIDTPRPQETKQPEKKEDSKFNKYIPDSDIPF